MTLPLDLVSGAAAAYSTRKLRSAYAGSAVKVRRVSDSVTQNIGFSANDFDSGAFTTFIGGSTGTANIVYDQANANDATQGTTGNQPAVATRLSHYGIGGAIASSVVSAPDDTTIQDIFSSGGFAAVVFDNLGAGFTNAVISKGEWVLYLYPGGGDYQLWFYVTGASGTGFWGTNDVVTSNARHVVTVTYNAATPTTAPVVTLDGVTCTFASVSNPTGAIISDATLPLELINDNVISGNNGSLGGTLYEALFYKGAMSAANRAALVANIQTFYQIGNYIPAVPDSVASPAGVGKGKNNRVWRVILPDGKIAICHTATEYYNLLMRLKKRRRGRR